MEVKILIRKGCDKCKYGKDLHKKLLSKNISSKLLDVEEPDGMAEAIFYGIQTFPYIIVCDSDSGDRYFNSVLQAEREIIG